MTRKEIAYLALAFSTLALVLYSPALSGSFVGDDYGYVVNNLYIQTGDPRDLLGLLDPFGPAALFIGNYAPLHLLAHAAELSAFGADTLGYHVVNVLVHGIGSALLAALFVRSRIPWGVAVLLALIFLVHPANVEAVAWVSQLKTCLSFALSVAALLALRRPVVAWALFTAALLTKFSAWYALPVAAVALWREGTPPRGARLSLAAWLASFVLCAIPEFGAFDRLGHTAILVPYPDGLTHVRSILAYAARYFVMATTSLGVSAFQEPAPALSWTDPWCLAGIVLLGLLGARFVQALRARSEEAVYWCWALAAYAPISQVFPFAYPMGDRYLYFVLPGLLGAAWFWTRDVLGRVDAFQNRWAQLRQAGLIALVLLAAAFSWVSFDRARVWRSDLTVSLDAARHYPNGILGLVLRARSEAQRGDSDRAFAALGRMADRGFDGFSGIQNDPGLEPLRTDPRFDALVAKLADNWIRIVTTRREKTLFQPDLETLAQAQLARGERQLAIETLHRALDAGGPFGDNIRLELNELEEKGNAAD